MSYVRREEVITEEGYRLAPFLLRSASSAIDLVFYVGSFVLIFFLLTTSRFTTLIDVMGSRVAKDQMSEYQISSGLVYRNENNVLSDFSSEHFEDYEKVVSFYYLDYEGGSNPNNPAPLNYTIRDYNTKILSLPESDEYLNKSSYYDFARDSEGNALYDVKGVLKSSLYGADGKITDDANKSLLTFYREAYSAAQDSLMDRPYYKEAQDTLNKGYIVVESIAAYVHFLVLYLIIPL